MLAHFATADWVRRGVGLAFLDFAVWALIPDRMDEAPARREKTFGGIKLQTPISRPALAEDSLLRLHIWGQKGPDTDLFTPSR